MSLTIGPGPFSSSSRGALSPAHGSVQTSYAEPYTRRVRAVRAGHAITFTAVMTMLSVYIGRPRACDAMEAVLDRFAPARRTPNADA